MATIAAEELGRADISLAVPVLYLVEAAWGFILHQYGTPELKEMLDFTGAGNNPEIVRLFYRIGKAISDDNLVMSGKDVAVEKDQASIMFPNDN